MYHLSIGNCLFFLFFSSSLGHNQTHQWSTSLFVMTRHQVLIVQGLFYLIYPISGWLIQSRIVLFFAAVKKFYIRRNHWRLALPSWPLKSPRHLLIFVHCMQQVLERNTAAEKVWPCRFHSAAPLLFYIFYYYLQQYHYLLFIIIIIPFPPSPSNNRQTLLLLTSTSLRWDTSPNSSFVKECLRITNQPSL